MRKAIKVNFYKMKETESFIQRVCFFIPIFEFHSLGRNIRLKKFEMLLSQNSANETHALERVSSASHHSMSVEPATINEVSDDNIYLLLASRNIYLLALLMRI
jgi:hypothetical protein